MVKALVGLFKSGGGVTVWYLHPVTYRGSFPYFLALVSSAVNTPAGFWKTFFKVLLGILLKVS